MVLAERHLPLRRTQQQNNIGLGFTAAGADKNRGIKVRGEAGKLASGREAALSRAIDSHLVNFGEGGAGGYDIAEEEQRLAIGRPAGTGNATFGEENRLGATGVAGGVPEFAR